MAIERLRIIALRKLPELRTKIAHALEVQKWLETAAECKCPSFDECGLFGAEATSGQFGATA